LRLLLDTHALLWWLAGDASLSELAYEAINDGETFAAASVASVWEISIKQSVGRLRVPEDFVEKVRAGRLQLLSITAEHAWAAGALPLHHSDPFDRMLVAQAQAEGLTIVTRDRRIALYGVPTLAA